MKKLLRILFLFIIALVAALLLLPFVYKGELVGAVRDAVNKNVNAKVDFEDLDVSFIKSFPNVSLTLHKPTVKNGSDFNHAQLIDVESIGIDIDFMSFVKKEQSYKINSIDINKGRVNLIANSSGKYNYEIWKTDDASTSNDYILELSKYELDDINLYFTDHRNDTQIEALGVNHIGQGDFTQDLFKLKTQSDIAALSISKNNFPYLNKLKTKGSLDLEIDNTTSTYTISNNDLSLENLRVQTNGFVQLINDDIKMDLRLSSENEKFGDFLTVIPLDIKRNISDLETDGLATVIAEIKGRYSAEQLPSIDAQIHVKDGFIKNKDFSEPIKNIFTDLTITAKDKNWDDLEINLENLKMNIAGEDVQGRLKYANVMTDPIYDVELDGNIDLDNIHRILPIENVNSMQGSVLSDLKFKGSQANIESKNYSALDFKMDLKTDGLNIDFIEGNDIAISRFDLESNPQSLEIKTVQGKIGKSDYSLDGQITNPLAILTSENNISGHINHSSNFLDLDELTSSSGSSNESSASIDQKLIDNSQLKYTSKVKTIKYMDYDINNFEVNGKLAANRIDILKSTATVEGSNISASGNLRNAYNHISKNDSLYGDLEIYSPKVDLNRFTSKEESQSTEVLRISPLYNINLDLKANEVLYSDAEIKDLSSNMYIREGIASLANCKSKAMGGVVDFEGFYNSVADIPEFSFKYEISKFNFQETFKHLATFRMLAPAAEFIEGFFNSTLIMSGNLKNGFEPDYNTLSASGFLETINSKFSGYAPVMDLADKLGVDKLKQINLENTKNWFEVADGGVILKAHDYNVEDIKMRIGGKQNFNLGIDYVAQMEIPRDKIKNSSIGKVTNQGIDFLEGEAAKLGVNLDVGDFIYVDVNVTGTIKNPKFKIVPKGAGGKSLKESTKDVVSNVIEDKKKEYKEKADAKIESVKDTVSTVVNNAKDVVVAKAEEKVDKAVRVVKDTITAKVKKEVTRVVKDTLATKLEDKVKDVLGDQTGELDKLKDKLKNKIPGFPKKKNN